MWLVYDFMPVFMASSPNSFVISSPALSDFKITASIAWYKSIPVIISTVYFAP